MRVISETDGYDAADNEMSWLVLSAEEATWFPLFSGCNFEVDNPVEGANNNVTFPKRWGHWQCALWRCENDCPGCGWDYDEGFRTVGVPTVGAELTAWVLNKLCGKHGAKMTVYKKLTEPNPDDPFEVTIAKGWTCPEAERDAIVKCGKRSHVGGHLRFMVDAQPQKMYRGDGRHSCVRGPASEMSVGFSISGP